MFASSSTRRSKSSSNTTATTGARHETKMTTIGSNPNHNAGFVPKRKVRTKGTMQRRLQQRFGRTIVLAVVFFFFVGTGVLFKSNGSFDLGKIGKLRGGDEERNIWISQNSQPFDENGVASKARHLVMVAGHSVTVSGHLKDADTDEKDWFLLSYQKGQGLPQAIHAHITTGIEAARNDPESLLVFSGGETRAVSGPQTEAQAYYHVADAMNLWPSDKDSSVRARTTTEEFATDSFENFMFSIARFREVTGEYPEKITVVSFSFKRRRFETLHAPALRWPSDRFVYLGVDPPASSGFDLQRSTEGETKNAAAPFERDPYGCHSSVLQEKRKGRNPFHRTPPYELSCPEMKTLLKFCGPELIATDEVPWENGIEKP